MEKKEEYLNDSGQQAASRLTKDHPPPLVWQYQQLVLIGKEYYLK